MRTPNADGESGYAKGETRKAGTRDAGREMRARRATLSGEPETYGWSCLGLPLCLLVRAASRPRPARSAGDRLLARAVSLDPARTSTRGALHAGVEFHGAGKVIMLRTYPVILEVLRQLRPVVRRIELKDKDLARQLRRCSVSVALNVAEGMHSRGGNRTARYHTALACEANANCAVETGVITQADRSAFVSNCVSGFKQNLDCSRVTKVTGHPDACEADVAATPCAQFMLPAGLPLPASCRSIFQ